MSDVFDSGSTRGQSSTASPLPTKGTVVVKPLPDKSPSSPRDSLVPVEPLRDPPEDSPALQPIPDPGMSRTTQTRSSLPAVELPGPANLPPITLERSVYFSTWAPPSYDDVERGALMRSGEEPSQGSPQKPTPWRTPSGDSDSPSYEWPDAPDSDIEDNDKLLEPEYKMDQALLTVPGYEMARVNKESKPATRPMMHITRSGRRDYISVDKNVTSVEAKICLLDMTSDRCCYGNTAAKEMEISSIEHSEAVRYTLKTFVETRYSKRSHVPFTGQPIDGQDRGIPPSIWDLPVLAPAMYRVGKKTVKVPHCSTVNTCYACTGRGFNKCYRCKGRGRTKCKYCKAKGQRGSKDCEYCRGKGRQSCFRCNGIAVIKCSVCEGFRNLEYYIDVVSKFDVKEDEYLHHTETRLPRKLLRRLRGISIFDEEGQTLEPLRDYTVTDVNAQSEKLVVEHASVPTERLLSQKQRLYVIPLVKVSYTWNEKVGKFWLYGQDRKVYAPDYPQQLCCTFRCTVC